jgi:cytoskeletal protein CcmA (bactofilin family)
MTFLKKIKAGALQYVLVISVIIAIIIVAFISLVYLQQRMNIKHQFTKEAIAAVQLSFESLKQQKVRYNLKTPIHFYDNETAVTTLIKKHWGIFDLAIGNSKVGNEFFQKIGLLGVQKSQRDALYLKDNNNALVLVGKTKITGAVSLPKQGVKSGNIAGVSFYGDPLINSTRKASTRSLPQIQNIEFVKDFYQNHVTDKIKNMELEDGVKLHQSFTKNTGLYAANKPILLKNISLSGNIVVSSKTAIVVEASANLEDIILIAPKIRIEKNTTGNFQAIAKKSIEVASGCTLHYPTALILLNENDHSLQALSRDEQEREEIHISKNTLVKGMVVYCSDNNTSSYKTQIQIDDSAVVQGEVYCAKNLALQGSVFGSVYTNHFIVKKSGGVYVNHLYNAIINAKKLPIQYVGLLIENESNSVAKWLN